MSIRSAILATALTILPTAAFADTFTVYQATGIFVDSVYSGPDFALGGTLTFDFTTGTFTADTLALYSLTRGTPFESFVPRIAYQSLLFDGRYDLELYTYDPGFGPPPVNYSILELKLPALPVPGEALNICSLSNACIPTDYYDSSLEAFAGHYVAEFSLASGQLTPTDGVTTTPEPSSLALLGTGLFALCIFAWPSLRLWSENTQFAALARTNPQSLRLEVLRLMHKNK